MDRVEYRDATAFTHFVRLTCVRDSLLLCFVVGFVCFVLFTKLTEQDVWKQANQMCTFLEVNFKLRSDMLFHL